MKPAAIPTRNVMLESKHAIITEMQCISLALQIQKWVSIRSTLKNEHELKRRFNHGHVELTPPAKALCFSRRLLLSEREKEREQCDSYRLISLDEC